MSLFLDFFSGVVLWWGMVSLLGFLRGVGENVGAMRWCFCGEFVVDGVTTLVLRHHDVVCRNFCSVLRFIFRLDVEKVRAPFRESRTGVPNSFDLFYAEP